MESTYLSSFAVKGCCDKEEGRQQIIDLLKKLNKKDSSDKVSQDDIANEIVAMLSEVPKSEISVQYSEVSSLARNWLYVVAASVALILVGVVIGHCPCWRAKWFAGSHPHCQCFQVH